MSSVDEGQLQRAVHFARPRLRGHAGDMEVAVDDEGNAVVTFLGACESCPAMAVTFAGLVQASLESVDGITRVTAPQVHASSVVLAGIRRRLGVREVPSAPVLLPTPTVRAQNRLARPTPGSRTDRGGDPPHPYVDRSDGLSDRIGSKP